MLLASLNKRGLYMKVLLINGSPHKEGNTYLALKECADVLHNEGIETEIFWIGNKPVRGCIGCGQCFKVKHCVFEDDNLNENIVAEVKKLIRNGEIKYIFSSSNKTNPTCKNLVDNYGVDLITINTMESTDGGITDSNEDYITIMNNNLDLFKKELYK